MDLNTENNITPKQLGKELYWMHTYPEIVSRGETIFREQDVIDLLGRLGHPVDPDLHPEDFGYFTGNQ